MATDIFINVSIFSNHFEYVQSLAFIFAYNLFGDLLSPKVLKANLTNCMQGNYQVADSHKES